MNMTAEPSEAAFADWAKNHDWRAQANREDLVFFAIQIRGGLRGRDDEVVHHWASEIVHALGVYEMSEDEQQGIVDRHFAALIAAVGEP